MTIRLDESREGGMNLTMHADTIDDLMEYGRQAGQSLRQDFCFRQHRYNRAIGLLPAIEQALEELAEAYDAGEDGTGDTSTYCDILKNFNTAHYKNPPEWRADPLNALAESLAQLGRRARDLRVDPDSSCVREGRSIPVMDTQIRHVATADRVPRHVGDAAG